MRWPRGGLKVLATADDGRDHVLNIVEAGGTLGELTVADTGPRAASVEVLDLSVVPVLD